jgi:chromosome segregation ATPase
MDLGSLGTFATLLLAVIALGAAAGVGFQRGKIGRLEKDLDRATTRADRAETRVEKVEGELHQCRSDLDALGRVVTGEAHWTAIGQMLEEHHGDATDYWRRHGETLERIAEIVEAYRR